MKRVGKVRDATYEALAGGEPADPLRAHTHGDPNDACDNLCVEEADAARHDRDLRAEVEKAMREFVVYDRHSNIPRVPIRDAVSVCEAMVRREQERADENFASYERLKARAEAAEKALAEYRKKCKCGACK